MALFYTVENGLCSNKRFHSSVLELLNILLLLFTLVYQTKLITPSTVSFVSVSSVSFSGALIRLISFSICFVRL